MHPETVLSTDPKENNFLSPINFKFILKRAPSLNFFLQKIVFPSVNVKPVRQATPFVDIWHSGVDTEFSPLTITYRVDENMENWREIRNWLSALGEEESLRQYAELEIADKWSGKGVVSDITVTILDSLRQPNYTVYFHDCFPIYLSEMTFDVTPNAINHQVATTSFRFTDFDMEKVI